MRGSAMLIFLNKFKVLLASMAIIGLLLGGCAGMRPANQQTSLQPDSPDGPMEGPGLFSGEDGSFTIFKR